MRGGSAGGGVGALKQVGMVVAGFDAVALRSVDSDSIQGTSLQGASTISLRWITARR
jgi:hypothetical protein